LRLWAAFAPRKRSHCQEPEGDNKLIDFDSGSSAKLPEITIQTSQYLPGGLKKTSIDVGLLAPPQLLWLSLQNVSYYCILSGMEPSIVTMARHNHNHLNFSAFPSRLQVPPSKSRHLKAFGKQSWQPSHSQPRPRSSTSTSLKTYPNMKNSTTQKRSHPDKPFADSNSGMHLHLSDLIHDSDYFLDPTGLELVDGPPAKKINTATTESELEIYNRRKKASNYADAIRKKRTLVFPLPHLFF
jgi:hypothetical protein